MKQCEAFSMTSLDSAAAPTLLPANAKSDIAHALLHSQSLSLDLTICFREVFLKLTSIRKVNGFLPMSHSNKHLWCLQNYSSSNIFCHNMSTLRQIVSKWKGESNWPILSSPIWAQCLMAPSEYVCSQVIWDSLMWCNP